MPHLAKLKTILQSKYTYYFLLSFAILYIYLFTVVIKYDTKIQSYDNIVGTIIDVSYDGEKTEFILDSKELVRCLYYNKDVSDLLGSKVVIKASKINAYNNTIPNTFNYKKYLYNNKIYLSLKVENIEEIKKANPFYQIKKQIQKRINTYSEEIRPYLNLFILGRRDGLNDEIYHLYLNNGIWHLFAISSLHLSLIIFILSKIFKNKYAKILISLFLFFFLFLVNFKASLLRAVTFYLLKDFLKWLKVELPNSRILLLSAFILILINPFFIYNVGFQYSFLITYVLSWQEKSAHYFLNSLKVSLSSFTASLPITINMNYTFNLVCPFLNLLYVPYITFLLFPLVLITFVFPFCEPILLLSIKLLEMSNAFFNKISLNMLMPKMNIICLLIYFFLLFLIYQKKQKRYYSALILLLCFNIFLPKLDNNYHIYYLDVGQGDSSLLIAPHQKEVIMIDTGGSYNDYHVTDNTMLFLKSLGIKKINLLILSHGDVDHAKETLHLLEEYTINNIIINKGGINALESQIIAQGHVVNNYKSKYFNFVNITKYYNDNENESSIISYFHLYNYYFLYLGDTSKKIEQQLLKDYRLKVDFLKIAHHGSKTSSDYTFLKTLNPRLAIISSGRNNIYHHPSEETLATLNDLHINYLNTQTSGTIEIILNQNNYTKKEYKP